MKLVFLDSDTLPHPLKQPDWITDWVNLPATEQTTHAVSSALQGAKICITNKIRITPAILAQCPDLKYICVAAPVTTALTCKPAASTACWSATSRATPNKAWPKV